MDERGLARVTVATKGGMLICSDAGKGLVTVDMGAPRLDWKQIPLWRTGDTTKFPGPGTAPAMPASAVSMGNPHCVLFVPDAEGAPR